MKTRMTERLGIQFPIMQGGMQWLGVPELAAAVSNAGGLGTINASCYLDSEEFRAAIRKTKYLTDKPFAINLSLTPETTIGKKNEDNIRIAGEEGVSVIETAGRSPEALRPFIQAAGMIHIHKCTSLKHALKAESLGADMVTLVGYEGAGHPGPDEIGTLVLINECCRKLKIPVLAAGGIVDGLSMAAMLALGAEGVVLGTRFVASKECWIHNNFKQVILNSTEKSTLTCQRNIKNMCRYYNNTQGRIALDMEKRNASLQETLPVVSGQLGKMCYESGDTEGSCFPLGVASAVIEEILSCKEIIDGMIDEAVKALARF